MKEYLVKDFSFLGTVTYKIVNEKGLFELLDMARNDPGMKISIYELGDCVLDWS